MERKKYLLILIFCTVWGLLQGQSNKSIYKAYINGNMNKWKYSMDSIDAIKLKTNKQLLDLINYQYGYIAWCISEKQSEEAGNYLKRAEKNLERLEQQKYSLSILSAYKAAFIGFEIGLSPYKAPFLGTESLDYAKRAVLLDSTNSFAYMQLGNIAYYTPKMFGGSKTEALSHYLVALKWMENNKKSTLHNWNYLNLLALLINAYMDLHQYERAKKYCVKTLNVEPEFDWVKNHLHPQVLKKLNK